MERYFIVVIDGFDNIDRERTRNLEENFSLIQNYQRVINMYSLSSTTADPTLFFPHPFNWALCIGQTKKIFKGSAVEELLGLLSTGFTADLPSEPWDILCFSGLNNRAIDVVVEWNECPDFWSSFDPSNHVKVFQANQPLNHQLFWRGTLKMKDPLNSASFGWLECAELSYDFDELDIYIVNSRKRTDAPPVIFQKKTLSPSLELIGAFDSHSVPPIFYSSASLVLTVENASSFWNALNENVSLLFRLDYSSEAVEQWEKEVGGQSIHFIGHWAKDRFKLFGLKNAEQIQNLANVLTRSVTVLPLNQANETGFSADPRWQLDCLETEIRRLQLLAVQTWIQENGSIDPSTMDDLLSEIALSVIREEKQRFVCQNDVVGPSCPFTEAAFMRWKLEKAEKKGEKTSFNRLLQPTGRAVTVDVSQILRSFGRHKNLVPRSPGKTRSVEPVSSKLKPTCSMETARTCSDWPQCTQLKYHGINYNLDAETEKAEKQGAEYQSKWVPLETESNSWCNPWSINSSSTYQLSSNEKPCGRPAVVKEARTPRKQQTADLAQLRKSPRLLAKTSRPNTRRTPSKKNPGGSGSVAGPGNNKDNFKQQLKAVIIRVLADQKVTTQDPLFRTCANKLSVICMALLKDSKATVTPRQMYQVAKSQAKQVLQFVKS